MVRYSPLLLSSVQKAAESSRLPFPVHSPNRKQKCTFNHVICHYNGHLKAELGGTVMDFGVYHIGTRCGVVLGKKDEVWDSW